MPESLLGKALLTVAASGLVAVCAHVSLPLPFTPVPLTLQTFAVVLVGMLLGPVAGFSAMALYLAEGAAGLPVFSPQGPGGVLQLMGPTGGYLLSYPLAAAAAGAVVRSLRPVASRFARGVLAGAAGSAVFLACGAAWLAHVLHASAAATWTMAVLPFLPGEAIKIAAAAGMYGSMQRAKRF